jgi:arylsulfatase A-like enzyme
MTNLSFAAHLRAAASAALLLALCQVVIEVAAIAARAHGFVLGPYVLFGAQMYDFCVKLFLLLPGGAIWLHGGILDRFYDVGFFSKLPLAAGLVMPNLIVMALLAAALAAARTWLKRPARVLPALWILIAIGVVVHLTWWLTGAYIPDAWTLRSVARNLARVLIWEGAFLSLLVLAGAGLAAVLIARRPPAVRWSVSTALAAACLAVLLLPSPSTSIPSGLDAHASGAGSQGRAQVDNAILISIDSLRADRLGIYGNSRPTSPTMDRLARQGALFTSAASNSSWTIPSHASMLTGRDVLAHGVINDTDRIPTDIPTLASAVQDAGITTGGIISFGFVGSGYGFERGFDHFDESIPSAPNYDPVRDEPAPLVRDLATAWLRERKDDRFFLFLHFWDVHYDYLPPPPYDRMFDPDYTGTITGENFYRSKQVNKRLPARDVEHLLALYDGEIRYVDDHLKQILDVLGELGLRERTAVIVTGDHGDEFFEHGYKGHGRTLYREVTHIPLIAYVPGLPGGRVIDEPVSLVDLMPTILDLLGIAAPEGLNGTSLAGAIAGAPVAGRSGTYGWLCSYKKLANCQASQHSADGTLIHVFQPMRLEYYGNDDRAQKTNLAGTDGWSRAERLAQLREHLGAHWHQSRSLGLRTGPTGGGDAATSEQLRNLGYGD